MRALPRLGERARIGVTGDHDPAAVLRTLPDGVEHLGFYENTLLGDARPLASLPSVRHLNLVRCPQVEDLSPLAEMGLASLYVQELGGVAGLGRLRTLRTLTVVTRLPGGLTALPQDTPLTWLALGGESVVETGLRGLSTWQTLDHLYIRDDIGDLGPEDWAEIARLPHLTFLGIREEYLPGLLSAPELPALQVVHVSNVREDTDLTPLSRRCPQVRVVNLYPEQQSRALVPASYPALFPGAEFTVQTSRPLLL